MVVLWDIVSVWMHTMRRRSHKRLLWPSCVGSWHHSSKISWFTCSTLHTPWQCIIGVWRISSPCAVWTTGQEWCADGWQLPEPYRCHQFHRQHRRGPEARHGKVFGPVLIFQYQGWWEHRPFHCWARSCVCQVSLAHLYNTYKSQLYVIKHSLFANNSSSW